jgi:hypothetical protein
MTIRVQQSFERRLKRKGIQVGTHSSAANKSARLASFKELDFWIWDKAEHERKYNKWIQEDAPQRPCCYNHSIGLPRKNDIPKPLLEYEKEIYDALQQTKYVSQWYHFIRLAEKKKKEIASQPIDMKTKTSEEEGDIRQVSYWIRMVMQTFRNLEPN